MKKLRLFGSVLFAFLASAGVAWAVVQSINSDGTQGQVLLGGTHISVNDGGGGAHTINFSGTLGVPYGGTGRNSFTTGSILFSSGASISQDNTNLFWDNNNKRLGVGTNSPTVLLDVAGEVKATKVTTNTISATGTNQSLSLSATGTGKVLIGGDSIVVASKSSEPSSPKAGQIYFDTTLGKFRGYNGIAWTNFATEATALPVKLLVVAGGGAGGGASNYFGAGGGAGGVVYDASHMVSDQAYSITVGSGGTGVSGANGNSGGDSIFSDGASTVTAIGGGGGKGGSPGNGTAGGSGSGGLGGSSSGGAGTQSSSGGGIGYGNAGAGSSNAGGGGGAGATGSPNLGDGQPGGAGGVGIADVTVGSLLSMAGAPDIDHTAAGGAGGGETSTSSGGNGGGGNGGYLPSNIGMTSAIANTGSGGGGASSSGTVAGGDGGSGIVIIGYPTGSLTATGGTVTTSEGNTIHTFTSSGTFTVTAI